MMDSRDSAAFLPLQEDQRVTATTRTRTELTEKRETVTQKNREARRDGRCATQQQSFDRVLPLLRRAQVPMIARIPAWKVRP